MSGRWLWLAADLLPGLVGGSLPACSPPARYAPGRVLAFRQVAIMDTVTAVVHGQAGRPCGAGPLPATVQLVGLPPYPGAEFQFSAVASARGSFQFMHIPPGTYRLSATCPGYGALAGDTLRLGSGSGSELAIGLGCRLPQSGSQVGAEASSSADL